MSPEKYTIREQISMLAGAREVICTEGTLYHFDYYGASGQVAQRVLV